uniref:peroxisomal trans-2-enoyl-CoA reductase-like n=1 Tax=Styela clava TaxID=7725 RepID=UPI001939E17B|nr:peroxisomal trans-2-enoyl-CoA reductase-like [Styela clava]
MLSIKSVFKPNLFANNVAIVTGGATGIGAAIAHELSFLGCNVMIASRNAERLKTAEQEMQKNDKLIGKVISTQCNIRKENEVENLMKKTMKIFGKIDFLVNNGGGQFVSKAEKLTEKGWHAVIETNLTGTFYCCKHAYMTTMKDHGGAIVNITADMWKGMPYMAHTSAARAGVVNLTKTLSLEWASHGVRINSVAPGIIYSPTARANYKDPTMFDKAIDNQPSARSGTPEEISAAVCFLLSPAAAYISGETLKVDAAGSLYKNFIEIPKHDKLPAWSWDVDPKS